MLRLSIPALLSLAACLLLAGCGQRAEPDPVTEGPSGPPQWRRAEAPAGSSAIQFHSPSRCFIRFRVEGASDAPHT